MKHYLTVIRGEPMTQFTVSNIWAMDSALAAQLERWRFFRKGSDAGSEDELRQSLSALRGNARLTYFFSVPQSQPGSIEFTPLMGRIQVSGDYSFEI